MKIYTDARGIEWIRDGENMNKVVWHERRFVVVKVPGHTVSEGIGLGRTYVWAEFVVYEDVSTTQTPDGPQWSKAFGFPVRS